MTLGSATENKRKKAEKAPPVPTATLGELFQFATPFDYLLIFLGAISAAGTGAALPLFILLFGTLLDQIGSATTGAALQFEGPGGMLEISLWMVYLGVGCQLAGWVYGWTFEHSKERQIVQLRKQYLHSILRQDVGWFDTSDPQTLPGLIGSTQTHISDGLSSKTLQAFEFIGMGIAGFAVSLYYGWDIAVVSDLLPCARTHAHAHTRAHTRLGAAHGR